MENYIFQNKDKKVLMAGMAIGILCLVWSFVDSAQRGWVNYLTGSFYFLSLALGGLVFVSISNLAGASWFVPFKRLPESFASFLPLAFLLMLGLFGGIHTLYEWSHHDVVAADPILQGKQPYLNSPFFMIRTVIFFVLWFLVSHFLRKTSAQQGRGDAATLAGKLHKWSALFLIVFAFSYSLACVDWIMSLKPHWFSTIFAVYNFSGLFVNTLAFLVVLVLWLQKQGYLRDVVNEEHFHDLGKFIFGFATFWAYIWFSQYILIWYSNIPEETAYFVVREEGAWSFLFYFNLFGNWIIPFAALMTFKSKRNTNILLTVSIALLLFRWLDIYLMVAPDVFAHAGIKGVPFPLAEMGVAVGFFSLFSFILLRSLQKGKLLPKEDPFYLEGVHFKQ